jgi:hypothetical protein
MSDYKSYPINTMVRIKETGETGEAFESFMGFITLFVDGEQSMLSLDEVEFINES